MTALELGFVAVVAIFAGVALVRPWIGLCAYAWVGLMVPHRMIGGAVYDLPAAKVLALGVLIGLLTTRQWHPPPRAREWWWLAAFWLVCVASTFADPVSPDAAWFHLERFTKVVGMLVPTVLLLADASRLRAWLSVIALSLGAVGLITGARAVATGFSVRLFGPEQSVIGDNNALAFALVVAVPLLVALERRAPTTWQRWGARLLVAATIAGVVGTYSRGSLVVLALTLPATLLCFYRTRVAFAWVPGAALAVALVAPPAWLARMATIQPTAYRDDASGAERMKSWYVAWRLGLDHPLLGAGFRPFAEHVYERYIPGYRDYHNAHNHFLQVLAEHGFTGLALFVAILTSTAWRLITTVRRARDDPDLVWAATWARGVGLALLAYVLGGAFINLAYFELLYWLIAAAILIERVTADLPATGARDNQVRFMRAVVDEMRMRL